MMQLFVKKPDGINSGIDFERKLYIARRVIERKALELDYKLYFCSFSSRTIVYKGMLVSTQVRDFYLDLKDTKVESAIALVHSRFSTNTFPSWDRAHPNRFICHNGEINTIRGNVDSVRAREGLFESKVFNGDLKKVIPFGEGIRICKNDIIEVMFSFVISANNNIPRIKKIIENLCKFGKKCDGFNAFPTLEELKELPLEVYSSLGAGYRDKYLFKLSRVLTRELIFDKMNLETNELRNWLVSLPGIGPKVADCILLFGFSRMDCFPVDTWVSKIYEKFYYQGEKTRPMIAKFFVDRFKQNAGYAQQYLFYGARSNEFLKV